MGDPSMSVGLILSGGGARASYQVGVLRAIVDILPDPSHNPFPVICGASAGAINASLLACESDRFSEGVTLLDRLWTGLDSNDVHRVGIGAILSSVVSLLKSMGNYGHADSQSWSLLDNSPLRDLLGRVVRFHRLDERISASDLAALSVSTLGYSSGDNITFFQARKDIRSWRRHRRVGVPVKLSLDHLMASTAIPGIYPALQIHREYFGDGAVRHNAPLSPALHLGATRLFVIGVSHNLRDAPSPRVRESGSPSLAQMLTQLLNASFIDAIEEDMESLMRLNQVVDMLSAEEQASLNLHKVDVMHISPSRAFDEIAEKHISCLPRSIRFLFRLLGATGARGGASLASFLLFEAPFIKELIECGYDDAMEQREEILAFLTADSLEP